MLNNSGNPFKVVKLSSSFNYFEIDYNFGFENLQTNFINTFRHYIDSFNLVVIIKLEIGYLDTVSYLLHCFVLNFVEFDYLEIVSNLMHYFDKNYKRINIEIIQRIKILTFPQLKKIDALFHQLLNCTCFLLNDIKVAISLLRCTS